MLIALILLTIGLFLSAFFSGAETGFYRVTRVRLVLDGLAGDWIARGLLRLTNYPTLFVGTTLVGNNLANYLTSLAIVLGCQATLSPENRIAPIVATMLLAPLVFVYGELMPKHVFYQAPNRMLRRAGPPLLVCTILFLPITMILFLFSRVVQLFLGQSPQQLRLALARRELAQVLEEGHEAGLLREAQRGLAQGLFALASQPVREFAMPAGRIARVHQSMAKQDILRIARRHQLAAVPVEEQHGKRELIGYWRVVDLRLDEGQELPPPRALVEVPDYETYIGALMRLQRSSEMLGRVVAANGQTVGFITSRHLCEPLFRGQ